MLPADPELTHRPAFREPGHRELWLIAAAALIAGLTALAVCFHLGLLLLIADAETSLGLTRSLVDFNPGYPVLFSPKWLPLSSLMMLPFVWVNRLWQNGLAGAIPSLLCYVTATVGIYKLARRMLPPTWALVAGAAFGLNANLLYFSTTALTEPGCIATVIWMVLSLCELLDALDADPSTLPVRRLMFVGTMIWLATWTRYEAWTSGFIVWSIVAWQFYSRPALRLRSRPFLLFSLLAAAGVLLWVAYSQLIFHDWLQFLRGPYSVHSDVKRMAPNGYPGKGDLRYAFLQYTLCARLMAGAWKTGWLVEFAAVAGTLAFLRTRRERAALILWMPMFFYVYTIRSGSLVIFVRPGQAFSMAGVRYGIELLPAATLFATGGLWWLAERARPLWPKAPAFLQALAFMAIIVNLAWMLHSKPAIVQEAYENSKDRLPLETALAAQLRAMPGNSPVLMNRWGFRGGIGALEQAGFPLRRTIDPYQGKHFTAALETPAQSAAYVVTAEGDQYSLAVAAHPEGLQPMAHLCSKVARCVTVYRSTLFGAKQH